MKNKILLFITLFFTLLSCTDNKPKNQIPTEKLIRIVADTYVAEGIIEHRNKLSDKEKIDLFQNIMDSIYTTYQVDSVAFKENYMILQSDIEALSKFHKAVIDTIRNRNKALNDKTKPQKPKAKIPNKGKSK